MSEKLRFAAGNDDRVNITINRDPGQKLFHHWRDPIPRIAESVNRRSVPEFKIVSYQKETSFAFRGSLEGRGANFGARWGIGLLLSLLSVGDMEFRAGVFKEVKKLRASKKR